jgi:hypothetical protein
LSPEKEKSYAGSRPGQPTGEVDGGRVSVPSHPVDVRPPGKGQTEHPGDLVERLAGGIVHGGAQRPHVRGHVGHEEQRRMAAGDQQRKARLGQRAVLQLVHRDVGGEVVDAVQGLVQGQRVRLGSGDPDQQCPGQSRARGDRDGVHVREGDVRFGERPLDRRHHRLEMGAARHLGDHAAEPGMLVDAGGDRVGEQRPTAHDADAGLVARRLDAEHERSVNHGQ